MGGSLRRDAGGRARRRRHSSLSRLLIVGLGLLVGVLTGALEAQAPTATMVGEVTVVAARREQALGVALAEAAGEPREWPGLGRRTVGAFRLIVLPDAAALAHWSGGRAPRWGAALTLPRSRTILLRADADPLQTFQHELAHLVLNDVVRTRVPLWFDEGYAVWAAGEWDLTRQLALNLAVTTSATPSLDTLSLALRGDDLGVGAAYALAASAVLELARRHPTGSIGPLLARLQAGEGFAESVLATTGLTLDRFDEAWRQSVRRRFSALTWLLAGGAWAVLGLVTVVAIHIRRRADRPRRLALDEDWELPPDAENQAADVLDPPPRGE